MKIASAKKRIHAKGMFSSCVLVLLVVGCAQNLEGKFDSLTIIEGYKNIILMIGDGMGENHIKVTEAYNQKETAITDKAIIKGYMTTASSSSSVTDSAASATAMSTGQKVPNKAIAYKNGTKLTTMSEFAKAYQKGVGIIATETVTGATPAAFSSHNRQRSNTDEIALEQFQSDIDLFIGAGKSYFDQQVGLMSQNQLSYYSDFLTFQDDLDSASISHSNFASRFLAAFDTISTTITTPQSPTLSDIVGVSLNYLSSRYEKEGFFALIEGSHIDKRAHDGDIFGMIEQLNGFDRAVGEAVDWAREHGDTFVMVTADHETGGLKYDGEVKSEINDGMFSSGGHTSVNVPFYLYNNDNLSFISADDVIDNTDVAKLLRAMIRAQK